MNEVLGDLKEAPAFAAQEAGAAEAMTTLDQKTRIAFLPTGNRIVVERLPEIEQIGGIVIPQNSIEKPKDGVVVALGDGTLIETWGYRIPCRFELGDRVLIGQYSGAEIEIGSKKYVILREDEVLGVSLVPLPVAAPVSEAPGHAPTVVE